MTKVPGFWKDHRKCRCWQKPTLKCRCKQNQSVILTPAWLVFVSSRSVGQWSLPWNMRASFSIQMGIRNDAVFIDFIPLRKRKIMTVCSTFLVSVLEISIDLSTVSRKSHWLFNNSRMTTYKAPKNFFVERGILFHFRAFLLPLGKGHGSYSWHVGFPEGYLALTQLQIEESQIGWYCFSLWGTQKRFTLGMIEGRCKQLTESRLWPGRSRQALFSSCNCILLKITCLSCCLTLGN